MATYDYHCVDVFTERAFGGNQLTVFPDESGHTDVRMQLIARELNLSETTFVFPADEPDHTCKVRIFTPIAELPFAGHPTLGMAHVLVENSAAFAGESTMELVLEETTGPVPVSILKRGMGATFSHFSTSMMPEYDPPSPPAADLAGLLNIAPSDNCPNEPIAAVSCGVPYLFVAVNGLDVMRKLGPDTSNWDNILGSYWAGAVFAWTRETVYDSADIHARMFAPLIGITEDPATGSTAAALADYLGTPNPLKTGTLRWLVEQGLEMQRPSFLEVEADKFEDKIVAVWVGGSTVTVSSGRMTVPALADH